MLTELNGKPVINLYEKKMNKHSKLAVVLRNNLRDTGNLWGIKSAFDRSKKIVLLGIEIDFRWRSDDGFGRFGGGWSWELGIQTNRKLNTWIINIFFFRIRINKKP